MTMFAVFILGGGFGSILTFMRLSEEVDSLTAKLRKTQSLLDQSVENGKDSLNRLEANLEKLNLELEVISEFVKKKDQE